MINQTKSRGFTIVELLIVIVIIAILAAITIVAYNGITARAHTSAAQSAAQNVSNKAEAYNAELGSYPLLVSTLSDSTKSNTSYYIPASAITVISAAPTKTATDSTVSMQTCLSGATAIGLKIYYWDFANNVVGMVTAGATGGTCGPAYTAS